MVLGWCGGSPKFGLGMDVKLIALVDLDYGCCDRVVVWLSCSLLRWMQQMCTIFDDDRGSNDSICRQSFAVKQMIPSAHLRRTAGCVC